MRVTKIIREHVERTIRKTYDEKINAIEIIPLEKQEDFINIYNEFNTQIEPIIDKAMEDLKSKGYTPENFFGRTLKKQFVLSISDWIYVIQDNNQIKKQEQRMKLREECENTINDILIKLEIGEIDKRKLDEVLAPFKA